MGDILTIKIEPHTQGVPAEMFGDIMIAHQEILRVVVREENKHNSVPEFRVTEVHHGSMLIKGILDYAQLLMPVAIPVLQRMGDAVKNTLTNEYVIEARKSVIIPKAVADKLSKPVLENFVTSISAFHRSDEGVEEELYTVTKHNVVPPQEILQEEDLPEYGPIILCTGRLLEINWDRQTCMIQTEIDNEPRKVKCFIFDKLFMKGSVSPSMLFEVEAIPVFKINAFGERILKQLNVQRAHQVG
jgi:hypothetical protein